MNRTLILKKTLAALAIITAAAFSADDLFARSYGNDCPYRDGKGYKEGRGYGRHHRGIGRLNFLQKELGLSDYQAEKIHTIHKDFSDRFFENRNNPDRLEELRNERHEAVKKVLTEEQAKKLDELREKREERRKHKRGHGYNR